MSKPSLRSLRAVAACVAALGIGCAPAAAAAPPQQPADPYTGGDVAAMAKAGYVSFGPFPFGTNHATTDIEQLLPAEPLLWIETAHFRVGAALAPLAVAGDKEWVTLLQDELRRLAVRLPAVKADTKQLDPWLRAHLVAQRAEELYAEIQGLLGVDDAAFPTGPGDDALVPPAFSMGGGPYLGMAQKYTVLLLHSGADLARYTAAYHSRATVEPTCHHDHRFGSAFFGAAESSFHGALRSDLALHTHLAFHVAHNLYVSYRGFSHELPAWLPTGLSHWHARRVSTRFPIYLLDGGRDGEALSYEQWERRRRGGDFPPLAALLERVDVGGFGAADHLQCWALVDFLMRAHRSQLMQFLHRMKDPFHQRLRFPTEEELFARQRELLRSVFGLDAAGLDEAWRRQTVARLARK